MNHHLFFKPHTSTYHPESASKPVCRQFSRCEGCPYPSHGFLCWASDLKEEFRLLADFGCAVLAGRERENDRGYQFVTWVWDFDRRGVSHGHYFEGNYHAAKEDFAVRSGLISRAQIFSADQLAELYRATDFFLEEGPEPEDKQMKALQEARAKIEYTVPDLQERLEPSQEPEMNL